MLKVTEEMRTMQINEFINSAGGHLIFLAIVLGVVGVILFVIANIIMKATGDSIERHAWESRRYRDMRATEQMTEFCSNPRNVPVSLGLGGILLFIAAIVMTIA